MYLKEMIEPFVSILMTAYNRQRYIGEAIESVLAIEYKNYELIIIDDRSSDKTFSIAKSYANNQKKIKLYQNEQNLGDYPNRNKAATYAKGKYIVYADSDDKMFPGSLIRYVSAMEEYKCSFGIFNHTGRVKLFVMDPKTIVNEHFFKNPILNFGPVATIVLKDYFDNIGGFPVKYGPANDMYYNLNAASQTNTLVFPFPLVDYRIHEGQEFNNKYAYLYNNYLYLRDALNELNLPLTQKQKTILSKKNKRRFLSNILKYYAKSLNLKKTLTALHISEFKFKDAVAAIFQL